MQAVINDEQRTFRSLCAIPRLWQCSRPSISCQKYAFAVASSKWSSLADEWSGMRLRSRESRRGRGTKLGKELTARDELQNEVDVGLGHHHVEQVDDVWMADRLHHLNLSAEDHGERARKEQNAEEMRQAQRGSADADVSFPGIAPLGGRRRASSAPSTRPGP